VDFWVHREFCLLEGYNGPMRYISILIVFLSLGVAVADSAKDLKIVVNPQGKTVVPLDHRMKLQMRLQNMSAKPVYVIKPGDGSESGWREPSMYFSAEKKTDQGWKPVERQGIGRCGLYDPDWQKDVVKLEPGGEINLGTWMPSPSSYFQLSKGTYRFRLHYKYTQGQAGTGSMGENPKTPATLAGKPAFSLASEPFVYTFE
jgi:hypothetical protein